MLSRGSLQKASSGIRSFASTASAQQKLRIGFVPEHFSTPLHFAKKHFGLDADLEPEPLGTGSLASRLKARTPERQIDVAIGLTEGFVSDLGKTKAAGHDAGYGLVGTYVESPLCWAISTGSGRDDVQSVEDLKAKKVGVSRIGSGSHIMSYVLADQHGWLDASSDKDPFEVVPIGDFAALRNSVNDGKADFFMWEHFTSKHYYDAGEIRRVGEIYTPWPSWMIAARNSADKKLEDMAERINKGVIYFLEHQEEAVQHIASTMRYSEEDAREWMKTVEFARNVRGVDPGVVNKTAEVLRKAGVLKEAAGGSEHMVAIKRASRAGLS